MAALENIVTAALTVVALGLTVIAVRAWRHRRSHRVGLLALGFALFLVKGLVLSVSLFVAWNWEQVLTYTLVLDLGVLGVFYAAVLS